MASANLKNNRRYEDQTTALFLSKQPEQSAAITLTAGGRVFYAALLLFLVLTFSLDWFRSAHLPYLFYSFYIAVILFRLACVGLALFGRPEIHIDSKELEAAGGEAWPFYTILVPLYHEPAVAAKIVRYLDRIEYPRDKLEVLLLLEQDDDLTRRALDRVPLPAYFRTIDVPDTLPRTKPKACNWGLREARGEYVVIYDAEDRPDPDQIKKAVVAFRRQPERVICLQAKLNYYNPNQNLLTRWFTIEYSAWFDLYLPGLYRLHLPIPLGGTSNHLRRRVLEEIGGWDPFNVAEDCDLGIRLYRMGYQTAMLDTTTWEEANSKMRNWVRQRSRWIKGYIQTHFVHTRKPLRTLGELGPLDSLSFLLSVGGHSLVLLVNPLFWAAGIFYLVRGGSRLLAGQSVWDILSRLFQAAAWMAGHHDSSGRSPETVIAVLFYATAIILLAANFLFIMVNLLGCFRRRLGVAYYLLALASPAYWVLISVAAWKGFVQLIQRPHYWEKTDHGLFPETEP